MCQLETDANKNLLYFCEEDFLSTDGAEVKKKLNYFYQVSLVSHAVRLPVLRKFFCVLRTQVENVNALYAKEVAPEGFHCDDISYMDLNHIVATFSWNCNTSIYERLKISHRILSVILDELRNVISIELYIYKYEHLC